MVNQLEMDGFIFGIEDVCFKFYFRLLLSK